MTAVTIMQERSYYMKNNIMQEWMAPELATKYNILEDDTCTVWYIGLIIYSSNGMSTTDVLQIAHMAIARSLDYNKLFGFYKIVVLDKLTGTKIFWGDNSGSQRFYYSLETGIIADTLTVCVKKHPIKINPCYDAIYQYLSIGKTLDNKTIVDEILMTSYDCIYLLNNGIIIEESKHLKPYMELDRNFNLSKLMRILTENIKEEHISAVITGGTDSRSILAHLISLGISPKLLITGRKESDDVRIAQKIADCLKLQLFIYNPNEKEPNWIQRAFSFSNGIYDVVLSHRHLKKAELSLELGTLFEFGGVGGEFYKNSYCRPLIYGRLFRKTTARNILKNTIGEKLIAKTWYGEKVVAARCRVYDTLIRLISKNMENGFLRNYNKFAATMLMGGFCNITSNLLPYCTKIDPLMDRNLIASVCWKNPLSLSMKRWQRNEIHLHCPEISDIETDKGFTCSVRKTALLRESLSMLTIYFQLAVNKAKRHFLGVRKEEPTTWDKDYLEAKKSLEYEMSVNVCKQLGIISKDATIENIPLYQVGFILMIGMFFNQYLKE